MRFWVKSLQMYGPQMYGLQPQSTTCIVVPNRALGRGPGSSDPAWAQGAGRPRAPARALAAAPVGPAPPRLRMPLVASQNMFSSRPMFTLGFNDTAKLELLTIKFQI
jgi:hypothetical protein